MLVPLPGPGEPSSMMNGKWKIVIHTFGMQYLENSGAYFRDQYLMTL
jgi:hypothetical protein